MSNEWREVVQVLAESRHLTESQKKLAALAAASVLQVLVPMIRELNGQHSLPRDREEERRDS